MARSLPQEPNLDHLKREAKRLLREAKAGEAKALSLLRSIPKYADADTAELQSVVSLHEIQHALARDYGHPGWKDLKRYVESLTPVLSAPRPVLKVDSFEEAVEHYVDWLGFKLEWDWREGPGAPTIAAFARDGFEFMINEYPDTLGPTQIHINVTNLRALVEEWNRRRPGKARPRIEPPYEFMDLPIEDPFGNILVFEAQDVAAQQKQRDTIVPKMREFIQQELDAGRGFPTPELVREVVGPPLGVAVEVLNEHPGYGEAFRARQPDPQVDAGDPRQSKDDP